MAAPSRAAASLAPPRRPAPRPSPPSARIAAASRTPAQASAQPMSGPPVEADGARADRSAGVPAAAAGERAISAGAAPSAGRPRSRAAVLAPAEDGADAGPPAAAGCGSGAVSLRPAGDRRRHGLGVGSGRRADARGSAGIRRRAGSRRAPGAGRAQREPARARAQASVRVKAALAERAPRPAPATPALERRPGGGLGQRRGQRRQKGERIAVGVAARRPRERRSADGAPRSSEPPTCPPRRGAGPLRPAPRPRPGSRPGAGTTCRTRHPCGRSR